MKERIAEAFIELVEEQNTYKVSVEAICKRANISKSTFYRYFSDKYEVTEYIYKKEIVAPLEKMTYGISEDGKLHIKDTASHIFAVIYGRKNFYRVLINETGQNSLEEFLIKENISGSHKYLNMFAKNMTETDIDYFAYCYAKFFVDLLKKWLNDERNVTPEKLANYFFFEC